jgi:hypothetical protein
LTEKDDVTGGWKKSPRWAGRVADTVKKKNAYKILVGKPEEKRPLGRPRR